MVSAVTEFDCRRERQFTVVNLLLLTFVISWTVPTALHWDNQNPFRNLKLLIANVITSDVLFLKFALDPLIYAWRLAQYPVQKSAEVNIVL